MPEYGRAAPAMTATNGRRPHGAASRLSAQTVTLGYPGRSVACDLSVDIPDNGFTVIVGPNACGKSTLLKALAHVMAPVSGQVVLDGKAIAEYRSKEVARQLGLLAQSATAPAGITVADLVARGRYPHQTLLRQWSAADAAAVAEAMERTGVAPLAARYVDELSGGQRQRVWLAMVLAQQTGILLLDEPTTFLDIGHQYELLDLCADLHNQGRTLVAVLHDLNQACRYATHLVAMGTDGRIAASGVPGDIVTAELVEELFGLPCRIVPDPEAGTPMIIACQRKAV
jgi:iron complex transport system ATP-binding protein